MMNIAQAAADVAKSSSYFTGQFVIDGVLLIAGLKAVEFAIVRIWPRGNSKGTKPGEGKVCDAHSQSLEEQGKTIVELKTKDDNREKAIDLLRRENREEHQTLSLKLDALLRK